MIVSCINKKLNVCISYHKLDMKKKIAEDKVIKKRMTRSQKEIVDEGTTSKTKGRKTKGKNSTESSSSKKVKINKESKKKRKIKSKKIVSIRTKTAATALFSAMNVLNPKIKKMCNKNGVFKFNWDEDT